MAQAEKIVPRHGIVAFYGVPGEMGAAPEKYTRMKKFTSFTQNKNPIEYARQYVDEPEQQTDVVGYAPSVEYGFDRHRNNDVLKDIVDITDKELVGDDAVREIVLVDTETGAAIRRKYSVIPGTEGDNINVYTYSGSFKCRGGKEIGTASTEDEWQTCTFSPAEE